MPSQCAQAPFASSSFTVGASPALTDSLQDVASGGRRNRPGPLGPLGETSFCVWTVATAGGDVGTNSAAACGCAAGCSGIGWGATVGAGAGTDTGSAAAGSTDGSAVGAAAGAGALEKAPAGAGSAQMWLVETERSWTSPAAGVAATGCNGGSGSTSGGAAGTSSASTDLAAVADSALTSSTLLIAFAPNCHGLRTRFADPGMADISCTDVDPSFCVADRCCSFASLQSSNMEMHGALFSSSS
mmetsp:Transcript_24637/g.53140  ORF Transcript_24637/g.53140 Transcript_24637/m.53140 type:complete len:243 (-) Transcript_24637:795-1523(-)